MCCMCELEAMAMAHLVPSFTELEDGDFPVRYVSLPEGRGIMISEPHVWTIIWYHIVLSNYYVLLVVVLEYDLIIVGEYGRIYYYIVLRREYIIIS